MDRQKNPMTNSKSKAIQRKSHNEEYTYTLTKREKGKKNLYIEKKKKRATKSINKSTNNNKL